jgi:ABC-type multidrug transport system ATPase subunit
MAGERVVILSTHIVPDVEAVATDIALIKGGRLVKHALPEDLLQAVAGKVWEVVVSSDSLPALKRRALVGATARRCDGVHARVLVSEDLISGGTPDFGGGIAIKEAAPQEPTLEDAYLYYVAAGDGHPGSGHEDGARL